MEKPAQWALVGAAWFMALTVAVIGFLAWRHFEAASAPAAPLGADAPLVDGATAICPVTHEKVVVGPSTPRLIYMNQVYYFSATADAAGIEPKRRFLLNPEAYVHPGAAPATPVDVPDAQAPAPAAPAPTSVPAAAAPTVQATAAPTFAPRMTVVPLGAVPQAAKP